MVEDNRIEWDIDANLPMYTRDYIKMERERHIQWHLDMGDSICNCGKTVKNG